MANFIFLVSCHILFKLFWLLSIHSVQESGSPCSQLHPKSSQCYILWLLSTCLILSAKQLFLYLLITSDVMHASVHVVLPFRMVSCPKTYCSNHSPSGFNLSYLFHETSLWMQESPNITPQTEPIAFLNDSYVQSLSVLLECQAPLTEKHS